MDTFIFDPATNDGKIVASVKQGSLKVISGLISKKNPDSLTVEVPEEHWITRNRVSNNCIKR